MLKTSSKARWANSREDLGGVHLTAGRLALLPPDVRRWLYPTSFAAVLPETEVKDLKLANSVNRFHGLKLRQVLNGHVSSQSYSGS